MTSYSSLWQTIKERQKHLSEQMNHRVLKERVFSSKSSGKNPRKPREDGISPHLPATLLKLPLQILSQQCQSLNEALEHLQPASEKLASRISEHLLQCQRVGTILKVLLN